MPAVETKYASLNNGFIMCLTLYSGITYLTFYSKVNHAA